MLLSIFQIWLGQIQFILISALNIKNKSVLSFFNNIVAYRINCIRITQIYFNYFLKIIVLSME